MIPLYRVHMPPEAGTMVTETLYSGYVAEGEKVLEFERQIGAFLGNQHVASVNSCTSALTLSLAMEDVGPGDEVITTPQTCMASNIPIVSARANIVWADINPKTGNMSPEDIERKITSKTAAILYVHWAGQPGDIEEISRIAAKHGIPVIEDAAHALGSEYDGKKIGNHAEYICFSFQAIKHLTTSDGGLIALNGPDRQSRLEKLIKIRWFGLNRKFNRSATKWETDITDVGYKMHMNDVMATIGLSQMPHLRGIIDRHTENAKWFDEHLAGVPGIALIERNPRSKNAAWIYSLLLDGPQEREEFAKSMTESGIAVNVVHVRNDDYSVFKRFKSYLPGVDEFCSRMINIPCGWWVNDEDREYILQSVHKAMK